VRGTTRDPRRLEQIEAAGAEALVGDPDRIATLAAALEHVGVACVLLGSAAGQARQLEALHGSRLEMLLSRMLDTTVRGIVWEAAGGVDPDLLQAGAQRVRAFCEDSRIPYAMLQADPSDHDAWLAAAIAAVERVLQPS
jgi:hypothetical protein